MSEVRDGGAGFVATHVVPPDGLPTWAEPDPGHPTARLDALLPVQLAKLRGDWAQVRCSNGWTAWLDGRLLVPLPHSPEAAARPLDVVEDPRPLLIRLERALADYRRLVEDLATGRCDLEAFRRRSGGVRLGAVVDGPAAWLLDLDRGTWYYCDGTGLRTYATVQPPPDGDQADSR
ncbi:SH3 domain-containing protein [Kitasatospora mediocidica]|uniref:hypothetical protein n=1 Tax=Kitasatospora mediocidica TaxID=58352 RepID=UPI00056AFF9B|nr:hypothetical protein [Kitasatospora mediocidica]